jgi:hypothetical protein
MEAARTPVILQRTIRLTLAFHRKEWATRYCALVCPVVCMVAGALSLAGSRRRAAQMLWVLFLAEIVVVRIHIGGCDEC